MKTPEEILAYAKIMGEKERGSFEGLVPDPEVLQLIGKGVELAYRLGHLDGQGHMAARLCSKHADRALPVDTL